MTQSSGIYERGTVVLDQPVDWPEGSPVNVIFENAGPGNTDCRADGLAWEDSHTGIRDWLEWFEATPPVFAGQALDHFEAELRSNRERDNELSKAWEDRVNKLNR